MQFEALQGLIRNSGLDFPETAFILNLHDMTACDKASRCPAPIFSTLGHVEDMDLTLPVGIAGDWLLLWPCMGRPVNVVNETLQKWESMEGREALHAWGL
jgi:hypothetical protein